MCITGFCGAQCDARKGGSAGHQQPGDPGSDEGDFGDGVPEDDDLFNSGQDIKVMEDAIRRFMDSMDCSGGTGT